MDFINELHEHGTLVAINGTIISSGVMTVSSVTNVFLLILILGQIGYLAWKWFHEHRDRKEKRNKDCK